MATPTSYADQETPTGAIDGVNAVFTLAYPPSPQLSLQLVWNGLTLRDGSDFLLSGAAITFLAGPPALGDTLQAWYRYDSSLNPLPPGPSTGENTFGGAIWGGLPGPPPPAAGTGFCPSVDDLLRSSFRCIGQLRPGFGHSPSERVDALFVLNAMLESWGIDDLNCFVTLISPFPLTPGQYIYSVGPGGDFNMAARPPKIDKATLVVLTNPSLPLRLDIGILDAQQYQYIHLQQTPSTFARRCCYFPGYPLGSLKFWPVPTEADNVELSTMQALSGGFTDGNTAFIAPPGYLDAVRYNLAVRLAMEWEKELKPGVAALASESLANIQRRNDVTPQMACNPAVLPNRRGGGFNWLDGEPT